jgi:hypothetical protein
LRHRLIWPVWEIPKIAFDLANSLPRPAMRVTYRKYFGKIGLRERFESGETTDFETVGVESTQVPKHPSTQTPRLGHFVPWVLG